MLSKIVNGETVTLSADEEAAVRAAWAAAQPQPVAAQPTPREWLERLPADRQDIIVRAMLAASPLWLVRALGTTTVDVTLQETVDGINAALAAGIITSAEAAILLAP